MSIFSRPLTCPSSRRTLAGIAGFSVLLWLPVTGCGFAKIEPEEIDIADESGTGGLTGAEATGDEAGTEGANDTGGDGDGDPSGDGDGDGDTDSGDGDGDGDTPCDALTTTEVFDGANPIDVPDGMSLLQGECDGAGPEAMFVYTAAATGTIQVTLSNATFEGAVYFMNALCEPLDCEPAPQILELDVTAGEVVYILIDSFTVGGTGSLEITPV
ncbi:hypothetical protein [Enhygromyxa salina]|uniref:Uncharacterized protein n=1 Tax=Enhygromyxa salina TaxID=215803 RepID=A0A2S9XPT7_9BACT|nr:hypothetical protein [Enhygromyxa salina]PRP94877.1 hypothetical protein ENSA7_77000 [Enhygromyxa salina]